MFEPQQQSTGTEYTVSVALLVIAVIFIPTALIFARPIPQLPAALAMVLSGICSLLAWINWKRYSDLTIPSIATQRRRK